MSLVEKALKKIQDSRSPVAHEDEGTARPDIPREDGRRASVVRSGSTGGVVSALPQVASEPGAPRPTRHANRIIHVDHAALRSAGLMPPEHQDRILADQYRQIKRPLIANALGKSGTGLRNSHLVMIASALPGEGKTFTSINLALSMALEKDVSILLVDADVAKPHVSKVFAVENEPGLLDVLMTESLDVESVILPTDVPGLSLLPAGRRAETATEFLASARMEETVALIAERDPNSVVLIDSPPLLLTSESRALAHVVGQVVLVVRAGVTPQQAVLDSVSYIGEGKSIGFVLNQSEESGASGAYYGYGTYGNSGGNA